MKRAVLTLTLLPLGIAATTGAAYMGLSGMRRSVRYPVVIEDQRSVTLGPSALKYLEGDNVLILRAEVASERGGAQYMVRLPGEVQWIREMPSWCRHRRTEVLAEIKRLSAGEHVRWIE